MHMIGDRIKQRRQELNMSRAELAERIGKKDRSLIFRYEKGDVDIPVGVLRSLSEALDVSMIYLLGLEKEVAPRPTDIWNDPIVLDAIEKARQEGAEAALDNVLLMFQTPAYLAAVSLMAELTPEDFAVVKTELKRLVAKKDNK